MKTTLKIKLSPTPKQHQDLLQTMEQFNAACDDISMFAFEHTMFSKFKIQKEIYSRIKQQYGLSAQLVIRAISKVSESYKAECKTLHQFNPYGAIVYDQRILSYKGLSDVSLWTTQGRQKIPMVLGDYQKTRTDRIKGQADLVLLDGTFYLLATLELPEPPTTPPKGFLGVDLGIVNLATTSDGETFSGEHVEQARQKYATRKQTLQQAGTKSAKRTLKKNAKKESRFRRDVNHCISKKLVEKAKTQEKGIALENLKGIRSRITVRRKQRSKHHGWAFSQMQQFIEYKAKLNGVAVEYIDPRNTSRTCSCCGHVNKKNRKTQSQFRCVQCDFSLNADVNAAINISSKGVSQCA